MEAKKKTSRKRSRDRRAESEKRGTFRTTIELPTEQWEALKAEADRRSKEMHMHVSPVHVLRQLLKNWMEKAA